MAIQWYPGHMTQARKKAEETMEFTDVVIEVLDARVPEASHNPMIDEMRLFRQRPQLTNLIWLTLPSRKLGLITTTNSLMLKRSPSPAKNLGMPLRFLNYVRHLRHIETHRSNRFV